MIWLLLLTGLTAACTIASAVQAGAASSNAVVNATVLSSTSLDTTACAEQSFGAMTVSSTAMTAPCTVSFGSNNDTSRLRAYQRDQDADAMSRHSGAWTPRRGLDSYYAVSQSPDGARMWAGGLPFLSGTAAPLRTSVDGGTTWTDQTPCAGEGHIQGIHAISALIAITVGVQVCRTTDGGATWDVIAAPGSGAISAIDAAPGGELWAAGIGGSNRMLRSADAGVTWTTHPIPAEPDLLIYGIAAISGTSAVAVGRRVVGGVTSESMAYRTTDGGSTWTGSVITTSTNLGHMAAGIDRSAGGTLIVANYGPVPGLWRSTDGGVSWTGQSTHAGELSVRWTGGTTWLAAFDQGSVVRSTDDGLTWGIVPFGPSGPQIRGISDAVGGVVILVGLSQSILRSTDGGATGANVMPADSYAGVAHLGDRRFVVVGDAGKALYSTNGGATLTAGATGTGVALSDVVADAERAVAIGGGGTVIVSDDDGATWSSRSSGVAVPLVDIDRASLTSELVAVGGSGVIRRSRDGGESWSAVTSPTALTINAVAVSPDGDDIWIADNANGSLWHSANRGASWIARNTSIIQPIVALDASSTGTLLAAHETLLDNSSQTTRSTDGGASWSVANNFVSATYDVQFSSPGHAWLSLAGGGMSESVDGGATFSSTIAGPTGVNANLTALDVGDGNTIVAASTGGVIVTTEPDVQVPDIGDAGATLTSAGGAFGACVESGSGALTNPWPVTGGCVTTTPAHWNAIPRLAADTGSTIATTASGAQATVDVRFGFHTSANLPSGTYRADIVFELIAPG